MTRRNKAYWQKRAELRETQAAERTAAYLQKFQQQYERAAKEISGEIDRIILRYGGKHGLTYAQATRFLDRAELKEWKKTLEGYVAEINAADPALKKQLLARLDARSANSSITRLYALLGQIEGVLDGLTAQTQSQTQAEFRAAFAESYYKKGYDLQQRAGILSPFARIDEETVEDILAYPWSGAAFSERLWRNRDALAFHLREKLTEGFLRGSSRTELAKELAAEMGRGFRAAETLIRTESAWLHGEADKRAYRAAGVETYEFIATLDSRTSEICAAMDGKIFPVEQAQAGVNYPPMHPRCRSTTVEHDPEEAADWAAAGIPMPKRMTYEKWRQKQEEMHGEGFVERERKKAYNQKKDREQLERYQAILGKDAPKELRRFQKMKYAQTEQYRFLKLDVKRRTELREHPERALPNASSAILPEGKFTKYLFHTENPKGFAKGQAFALRLGYDLDNWQELQQEIRAGALRYPAAKKEADQYGVRYEQKMVLYGKKGTPANVIVGWIEEEKGTRMTSAYIKEVQK